MRCIFLYVEKIPVSIFLQDQSRYWGNGLLVRFIIENLYFIIIFYFFF